MLVLMLATTVLTGCIPGFLRDTTGGGGQPNPSTAGGAAPKPPGVPLPQPYDYPPADGILRNGSFERGLEGWEVWDQRPTRSPGNNGIEVINWAERGGRVLHLSRTSQRDGGAAGVIQRPNYDCSLDTSVWVTYEAYVNFEQGGNIAGRNPTQFPESGAQSRVKYLDVQGVEHEWYDGVFITPTPGADTTHFQQTGDNNWVHRVGTDLMTLDPKPVRIVEVRFYGFGWGFDSMLDECQLVTAR